MSVAPKNVPNGTRKCPHVIPAKSNKGFGIYKKKKKNATTRESHGHSKI